MFHLALLLALVPASAQDDVTEPLTCPPDQEWLDGHRWLRAISLDLRGVVPEPEEYAQLVGDEVPEALVDAWLDSDAFIERAVRTHRALLWNNVDDLRPVFYTHLTLPTICSV